MKVFYLFVTLGVPTGVPHWFTPYHLEPIKTGSLQDCNKEGVHLAKQYPDSGGRIFVSWECR